MADGSIMSAVHDGKIDLQRGYDLGYEDGARSRDWEIASLKERLREIDDLKEQLNALREIARTLDISRDMRFAAAWGSHAETVAKLREQALANQLRDAARYPWQLTKTDQAYRRQFWSTVSVDRDGWESEGGALHPRDVALAAEPSAPIPEMPPMKLGDDGGPF